MIIENQTVNYSEPKQTFESYTEMKLFYLERQGHKVVKPSTKNEGRFPAWATKNS